MAPGARRRRRQEQTSDVNALIKDLSELKVGDPVVHVNHGIGRYLGLTTIALGGAEDEAGEFLQLEYADKATLYVPVAQLHLIARYTGVSAEEAPLHKLGSGQWDKAKRKAAEQVRDTAAELLNLYARRAAREGFAFRFQPHDYEAFAASFGFEETPDQHAAIHAVIQDMVSPRPMDRLVCGDVGFGKTEVALRAAFVAVNGGKQVAILAPTTLLAEQHYQNIADRFGKWPIKVAELSRFRSPKEVKAALEGLADGTVDIVVGTHKLLSADVKFKRLGLLVIDEEHRFGVRHKEQMKALRAEVDVLTLTATPIPRTLGMALEGLRDLSVIATAPRAAPGDQDLRAQRRAASTIREAVLRELKRGGQVYFLHNDVETIEHRRETLQALVPEARIAVAHGQMPERELERVMRDFVAQRHNVLLCSTIIETGIDVPSANTIVISRADKFGLAQLHQLRGRVGRSHHQAYAYLLVPDVEGLTKQAAQRLEAIQQMEELGSGFYLAMHDLEIRGAGEVLGENQSGNMMEVGFQLYNDMLAEAVRSLKAGREPDLLAPLSATTEINLHAPALLPDAYCGDVHIRLSLYKRLASAKKAEQIDALLEEITDRFGKLPPQAQALFDVHRLRVLAKAYGVARIDAGDKVTTITFAPNPPIDAMRIIELVQKNRHIKLAGNEKLRIERDPPPRCATASSWCATCCARSARRACWKRRERRRRAGPRRARLRAAAAPRRLRPDRVRHGLDADRDRVRRRDRRRRRQEGRGRGDHRGGDARRDRRLQGEPAPPRRAAEGRAGRGAAARLRRAAALQPRRRAAGRGVQGGGAEDAARLGRLHLLHRPRPRPARLRLHAQQRARDHRRRAHRPAGRPALGRHLRRRRETEDAARDLRRAGDLARAARSPSATAPTTCR